MVSLFHIWLSHHNYLSFLITLDHCFVTFKVTMSRHCISHSDTYTTQRIDSTTIHKLAEQLESAVTTIESCCLNMSTVNFNLTLLNIQLPLCRVEKLDQNHLPGTIETQWRTIKQETTWLSCQIAILNMNGPFVLLERLICLT